MLNWLLTPHLAPSFEVVADMAYDSDALRGLIAAAGALAVILLTPRRRYIPILDPCAYAKRHHIEQTVNKVEAAPPAGHALRQIRHLFSGFRLCSHHDAIP